MIYFNKPFISGDEKAYFYESIERKSLAGDGYFSNKVCKFLEEEFKSKKVLLTPSCTAALELSSLLLDISDEDEIIMPSFTFVSTANSVMLRKATPVFVDIEPKTLNIDSDKISNKISNKTKAIYVVHYAGVACEMNKIMKIAKENSLNVVEDAAQGVNSFFKGRSLGTIGDLGCFSFHESKNFTCGEGGAILINNERFIEKAEIIREKGTNRKKHIQGLIDKYSWIEVGSSFLLSDILAGFLYAQLNKMKEITQKRKKIYDYYYSRLSNLEDRGVISLPGENNDCEPNYHIFYILLNNKEKRDSLIEHLKNNNIQAYFHYFPLHLSEMGRQLGYRFGDLPITEKISDTIIRLPIYPDLTLIEQDEIINQINEFFRKQ